MPPGACAARAPQWLVQPQPGAQPMPFINAAAISRDGSLILAGTFYRDYYSFDNGNTTFGTYCYRPDQSLAWSLTLTATEGVFTVAFSPDGTVAASGGLMQTGTGFLQIIEAASGALLLPSTFATAGRVSRVALSQDGSTVIAAANQLYVCRGTKGTYETPVATRLDSIVSNCDVSADGAIVVACTSGLIASGPSSVGHNPAFVYLFQNTGTDLRPMGSFQLPANMTAHCVRITPDGSWFALGGGGAKGLGIYALFNTAHFARTGQPVWAESDNQGTVYSVAIAPQGPGAPFVGVTRNGPPQVPGQPVVPPQVLGVRTSGTACKTMWTFSTLSPPSCIAFDAKGAYAAIADGLGSAGNFYVIDAQSGQCVWTCPTPQMCWPIMLTADASAVVGGCDDGFVRYFRM